MGEIQEIMRQFDQGNGEWQQFIKSIKINNIHGWNNQEMVFKFPIVAIVCGVGKSTFLKAAVCAYENKNVSKKSFYPSSMFMRTQWDEAGMAGATIEYKIRMLSNFCDGKKQMIGDSLLSETNQKEMCIFLIFLELFL